MNASLTRISTNRKTGYIPVSTSSNETCPNSCPFKGNGCYAEGGPVLIHWRKISNGERGVTFSEFCDQIRALPHGQLWRHNQAGDLIGKHEMINFGALKMLVDANKGRCGFTYTHYPMRTEDVKADYLTTNEKELIARTNRACVFYANRHGFTVNISANGPTHAKQLKKLGVAPVVSVVGSEFQTTEDIVVCPAVTRDDVSCESCKLCQKWHGKIIGFPSHGPRIKKVNETIWE